MSAAPISTTWREQLERSGLEPTDPEAARMRGRFYALNAGPAGSLDALAGRFLRPGGDTILDEPDTIPAIWVHGSDVLMAEGEPLMISGAPGVGKTTLAQQFTCARCGLADSVLGLPVTPTSGRVLYLGLDRPRQAARSMQRITEADEREQLNEMLAMWCGPIPADLASNETVLLELADYAGADTVIVDSLKDAVVGLTEHDGYRAVLAAGHAAEHLSVYSGVAESLLALVGRTDRNAWNAPEVRHASVLVIPSGL